MICGQVCVTGCGLGLGVAKQFSNRWKTLSERSGPRRKCMAWVVDADIVDVSGLSDAFPRSLNINKELTFVASTNDISVVFNPGDLLEFIDSH
jgi:hypothetical protein